MKKMFTPKWKYLPGLALAAFLGLFSTQQLLAQCTNPSQFGTINAPTTNTPATITTCAFAGEYSTINSASAGSTYLFNATGGAGNYITIRQGTPGGTVLGFGFAPISVTCTVSGPLYLHYNTNAACGTDGSCHTGTVQCTSCPGAPDPCSSISPIACATPTTATLSGTGLWSPGSCGFSTPGTEKVYSFTPVATGVHSLQVTSTNSGGFIDYFYKAASGGCSSSGWTCIDDIFSPVTVSIGTLTAGTTYYFLLDPETSASVTHTFQINCPVVFDPCATINTLSCATAVTASSTGTGAWSPSSCGFSTPGQEIVYSFTPAISGIHTLVVNSTNSLYADYFFKDASSGCNSSAWTCIDDVNFPGSTNFGPLTAGTTYYILFDPESTGTVTQNFQVNCPNPPVVLSCPTNTTAASCQTQAAVNASFAAWLATATGSGGCNGVMTNDNTGAPSACGGSTTVTFTYTSTCAPLTTTCQATFTVAAPPTVVLACPTNTTTASCQTQAAVNSAFATWLATATASGGCDGVLTDDNTGAPPACGGTTTVTFTYSSTCAPLTTTCQASFTVAAAPTVVLTCPNNTAVPANGDQPATDAAFAAWLATASASGGCNGVLTNNSTGAPDAVNGGSTTVTFTYTSTCAPLTTTCQATYTVSTGPIVTLNCPTNTTAAACQTQAAVNAQFAAWLATANASGGCNGVLTNDNTGAPSACGGSTTVTFTYTSTCAPLTTTCTATFTVATSPVVLTCPTNTTAASCQAQATVNAQFAAWLATASASGGCNGVLTNDNTGAPASCGGSTTVTFTYTSTCAPLTATCQATFTVATPPTVVLTCPTNTTAASCQTQAAVNAQFAAWLATASGSGGCDGVLTNDNTGAPAACGGSTTVTFTYASSCAPFTTTCTATFTVAAAPTVVLTCPTPTTASACLTQAQLDAAYAAWLASAAATGGCNGVLTNNGGTAPAICSATAVTKTVTFTYTGTCAPLTTTCTSTFTVPAYPTFTVPANGASTVSCPALIVQPTPPTVVDGCGKTLAPTGPAITNTPNPITCEGTRTYTWTYTDCAGLVRTWSHVATVERNPFTVPANGASTVACPANATQPTPPTVTSNCGEVLTPTGPTVTNAPNPLTCEGTRTYAWVYTDCEGNTATWSYVYTIERQPFTVPANGGSTVACPAQTDAQPTPPVVTSNCGEVLAPVISVSAKPICEGTRVYTFTYTDCEGNTASWKYTYTVEYSDFAVPANVVSSVECPVNATLPTPPTVSDNCGNLLVPVGPSITSTTNAQGCEGSRRYEWTYKDCEGNTHAWSRTYNFLYSADFFAPADEENHVTCLAYAVAPVPQALTDFCGQGVKVTGPTVTEDIAPGGCTGWRRFSYVYTDCGGHSHPWSFTYHINDNEGPVGTCQNGSGPVSINVTDLACIEDVPCPEDHDFGQKIAELVNSGNYYDVCSGGAIKVALDSWGDLWECSDPDGDGENTFGRTFYFRITDACGNGAASLCEVTYSGACQPLESFVQADWGIAGGAPGNSVPGGATDLQVIAALIGTDPIVIGGTLRSLTVSDAQCVVNLLPGIGGPGRLANCHQVNCGEGCNPLGIGGMKNSLAANAIALTLNMRYNVQYNELTMGEVRSQGLGCIGISPNIRACDANGNNCVLRMFDQNGQKYDFPYTVGGLLDLANLYLGGAIKNTTGQSVLYGTAINGSLLDVNAYWSGQQFDSQCVPGAGARPTVADDGKALPNGGTQAVKDATILTLSPNPAADKVAFRLDGLQGEAEVVLELYNAFGQLMLRKDFGRASYLSEEIDLGGLSSGLYIVSVKADGERFEQKLVISKD